ncbi:TIM barrel protein [Streptomyces sp. FXJ1.4098]|nr:TIM barrel protein [Streptomyces sp. FXJ1.4098]
MPGDLTPKAYAARLADHGISPAPATSPSGSPTTTPSGGRSGTPRRASPDTTRSWAWTRSSSPWDGEGRGAGGPSRGRPPRRPGRLERVRDLLAEIAGIIRAEGIAPAFHPHVGTWAETEEETRFVLDTVDASVLAFGPDMGHLAWAGADAAQLVRDYADRVASVHIKDLDLGLAAQAREAGWDYRKTVLAGCGRSRAMETRTSRASSARCPTTSMAG